MPVVLPPVFAPSGPRTTVATSDTPKSSAFDAMLGRKETTAPAETTPKSAQDDIDATAKDTAQPAELTEAPAEQLVEDTDPSASPESLPISPDLAAQQPSFSPGILSLEGASPEADLVSADALLSADPIQDLDLMSEGNSLHQAVPETLGEMQHLSQPGSAIPMGSDRPSGLATTASLMPADDHQDLSLLQQMTPLRAESSASATQAQMQATSQGQPEAIGSTEVANFNDLLPEGILHEINGPQSAARDVTEAAASARTQGARESAEPSSPLLRNVLDRLQELEQSEGRTRVLLRPQGLGILEIDVVRLADGRLQMSIRAENPLVLQSLEQDAGALSDFLGARGFDLAGGGPDLGKYSRPEEGENSEGQAGALVDPGADAPEAQIASKSTGSGLVDIIT